MSEKGVLIVISGPAGVGKGTLVRGLMSRNPHMKLSVSETTRAPRSGEVHGRDYYFVSRNTFERRIETGHYLEYDFHFDHYYGTPLDYVQKQREAGYDVILEIDVKGAENIRKNVPDAVTVFLLPPSYGECQNRIIKRDSETPEQLKLRRERFGMEIACAGDFEYAVINDDLDKAISTVEKIIAAEKCKTIHMKNRINQILGGIE